MAMKDGFEGEGERKFEMVQGVEMGRQSDIGVVLKYGKGVIESIELRGTAVEVMKGQIRFA